MATLNGATEELQTQPRKIMEMDSLELFSNWRLRPIASEKEHREQLVELSKRVAVPFGVIIFSILAIPLGVISKKGGKSYGFVDQPGHFSGLFSAALAWRGFCKKWTNVAYYGTLGWQSGLPGVRGLLVGSLRKGIRLDQVASSHLDLALRIYSQRFAPARQRHRNANNGYRSNVPQRSSLDGAPHP